MYEDGRTLRYSTRAHIAQHTKTGVHYRRHARLNLLGWSVPQYPPGTRPVNICEYVEEQKTRKPTETLSEYMEGNDGQYPELADSL